MNVTLVKVLAKAPWNLDSRVDDFFRGSEYEVHYGDVALQPLLFQDDVARLSLDLDSIQMGNKKNGSIGRDKITEL